MRRDELESMTSVQTLMHELDTDDWTYSFRKNRFNQVSHLFFSRKSSQIILKTNYEVLIMNCIYKTNMYKMLLMIIFDQIALHKTFYVAFCFMIKEKQNDYVWIMKQLKALYRQSDLSDPTIFVTDMKRDKISAIEHLLSLTWKKTWWIVVDWSFQASIIFFASDTSITMCWWTAKRGFSLKKHEMSSLLSEKRSCMLLLNRSIDNCEINSLIDTI
jgi:hypothetical protein